METPFVSVEWLVSEVPGADLAAGEPDGAGGVSIETLAPRHVAGCVPLWSAEGMIHEDDTAGRARELLRLCPGLSRVALHGPSVVGCALASYDGFAGQLLRVVVDPAWRDRGVGSTLVRGCVAALRARGARWVVLGCEERLVAWYGRLGFGTSPARCLVQAL